VTYFWTNTIWFILLGILTIFEIVYALYKSKYRKQTLAFYLTASGVGFVGESFLFLFFKAYNYYPMLIPGNTLHDGLVGNLFSQFSVAATALLIAVLNLDYRYFIIFAGVYAIIEELFLFLGIYRHNWYHTWMTVVLLLVYFRLVKIMYARLNNRLTPLLNYLYFFFALWPLHFGLTVFPFMVYGYQIYIAYIFSDPTSNETFLMILNYIVLYSVMRLIYFSNSKWCGNRLVY